MHDHVRIGVTRAEGIAEVEMRQTLSGDHVHPDDAFREHRALVDFFKDPEAIQNPRRIRCDLNAGADLAEFGCALDHMHVTSALSDAQSGSEATDAAADDEQRNARDTQRSAPWSRRRAAVDAARTGTRIAPSPWIEASMVSPGAIGPTPSGVPVKSTSPGSSVYHSDAHAINLRTLKMRAEVLAFCRCSPLTRSSSCSASGSA